MGVILTMTMVMMTGLAMTRERERGTMENLLAMPAQPLEVMTGKIVPYIFIGLIQATIILLAARYLFDVPFVGSVIVLYVVSLLFIAANLTVGITLSSLAQNQLQAMQLTFFYFLPTMLLSGFMFPFRGMPEWAQAIGNVLPATYFMRLVRGILLKGNDWADLWPNIWPLMVFTVVVMTHRDDLLPQDARLAMKRASVLHRDGGHRGVRHRAAAPARDSGRRSTTRRRRSPCRTPRPTCTAAARSSSSPARTSRRSGGRCSSRPRSTPWCAGRSTTARRSRGRRRGCARRRKT